MQHFSHAELNRHERHLTDRTNRSVGARSGYHSSRMLIRLKIIVSVVYALCSCAIAQTAPGSAESDKTWDLPGLSGTAGQIKVQLHQELEDLNSKLAAAEGDVRTEQAQMQKHREVIAAELAKSNETYQYVCKTIADSQAELASNKIGPRAEELHIKIDGFTKRRTAIEDQAIAKNADTPKFAADEASANDTVNRLKNELAKSIDWRCELGSAVRGGEMLRWPVVAQETGIIGLIRIASIDPSGLVAAEGQLFMPVSQDAKKTEGIVTLRVRPIPATFLISGWIDSPAGTDPGAGQSIFMDQMVRVTSVEGDRSGMTVRVERFNSDDDAILNDFREFRKPNEGDLSAR
jgi:hypothetical protein